MGFLLASQFVLLSFVVGVSTVMYCRRCFKTPPATVLAIVAGEMIFALTELQVRLNTDKFYKSFLWYCRRQVR